MVQDRKFRWVSTINLFYNSLPNKNIGLYLEISSMKKTRVRTEFCPQNAKKILFFLVSIYHKNNFNKIRQLPALMSNHTLKYIMRIDRLGARGFFSSLSQLACVALPLQKKTLWHPGQQIDTDLMCLGEKFLKTFSRHTTLPIFSILFQGLDNSDL